MPKQMLELACPFCGTSHDHEAYSKIPQEKVDCSCGATATLRVLKSTRRGTVHECEWSFDDQSGGADA
jgi:hypothetical protein